MCTKECVAMILAGGRGERLGSLTGYYSKPAVYFGGNYRIIDFTLSNCRRSGIDTIGILSQYFSTDLHAYISMVKDDNPGDSNIHMLPSKNDENLYTGTADAVYKNIGFIDQLDPECVLVLAGDHIYNMDYNDMIGFHKKSGADVTVAATPVSMKEASRFGILNANEANRVYGFEEKPLRPKSDLASMGIYVFKWSELRKYLLDDSKERTSRHDFGKDILPRMLYDCESVYAYTFNEYWRDVGTVDSLWEANMDQIDGAPGLKLRNGKWDVFSSYASDMTYSMSDEASVSKSIISGECSIFGKVNHSVLGNSVTIGQGSEVVNSVIMPNVYIGDNVKIYNSIIGTRAVIMDNTVIGANEGTSFFTDSKVCSRGISLVSPWLYIREGMRIQRNSHVYKARLNEWNSSHTDTAAKSVYRLLENRYHTRRGQRASLAHR